ncbi:hypothetical protein GCM10009839_37260 [Catenulispora yoronensis]|uniref:DUF3105 domain-containing protein n=1 Tax=Catenulispora yoronensis TaxID=450799 RepID=A0ABP5FWH0_9ACTN
MPRGAKPTATDRRAKIAEARRAEILRLRRRRIAVVSGASVAVAAVVAGVIVIAQNHDSGGSKAASAAQGAAQAVPDTSPDTSGIAGLNRFTVSKRNHVTTSVAYGQVPPVGGDHDPVWQNCNGQVYTKALRNENAVHAMEHGSVWVTYTAAAPEADVKALAAKVSQTPYTLMSPYPGQPGAIMLTAWGKQLTVDSASDPRVDKFFAAFVQGPQTPEPGAVCTGGKDKA